MGKILPKRTLRESVSGLFRCLHDLAVLQLSRNSKVYGADSEKKYSPGVEHFMELCDYIRGWDIDCQDLYESDGYIGQLWSDRRTSGRVVVILKQNCKKGCFPVLYLPVAADREVESVLKDALLRAGSEYEIPRAA